MDSPPAICSFGNNLMTEGVLHKMRAQIAGAGMPRKGLIANGFTTGKRYHLLTKRNDT
jgi:hypothetical protein